MVKEAQCFLTYCISLVFVKLRSFYKNFLASVVLVPALFILLLLQCHHFANS